jgi:2-succinyl-6-hydroxy-2,4-cyclohexadiene-1-carboxylate synthase
VHDETPEPLPSDTSEDTIGDTVGTAPSDMVGRSSSAPARSVVLAHGFTQSRACWAPFDLALASDASPVTVTRVDLPGHGEAAAIDVSFTEAADRLGRTGGRATYLGYSLGGRLCLDLACSSPELVERLVLVSASPGLAGEAARAARRASDAALVDRLEHLGLDAFLDEWLAQPLFASLPRGAAHLDERRRNTVAGLASSLRRCGTGAMPPRWDSLGGLDMPVLLIAGELDERFVDHAHAMAARIGPNAQVAIVAGAGHTTHLERPETVAALVTRWLNS